MKIWHFSDSHTYHSLLEIPKDVDIVIFSGDCSNPRDPYTNEWEVRDFIDWFSALPIKYKIFVAGNHDTSIEKGLVKKQDFGEVDIIYLENNWVEIEGIKIYGSPYTPQFAQWAFMKDRSKLDEMWKHIPEDTDILVVHGPPKGILDFSYNREGVLEMCGCKALNNHVLNRIKPKFCLFGHIHNNENIVNAGILKLSAHPTIFSNGSIVTDRKFGTLSSNGNILYYE